jgi:hypothetical protein
MYADPSFRIFVAYVEAVMSVPNRGVLNDSSASLLIKTPNRELKLTAPDMERHALWYKVCKYSGGICFFIHKGDQIY